MRKSVLLSLTVFFVLIFSLTALPFSAFAETEEASTESPYLYAEYFSEDGKRADGNLLSSGNYKMQLVLKGASSISEMEFTADYGSEISFGNFTTLADTDSSFNSLCKIENGSLILCLVSLNEDCSAITSDSVILFSVDIIISSDVPLDMENAVTENENPNYTFIEKNYGDINKESVPFVYNCYGFGVTLPADYSGTVTDMPFDMSPELPAGYSVKGRVVAMLEPSLPDESSGAPALSGVDVLVNGSVAATTNDDGIFEIPLLESGTYEAVLHYKNGFDRKIEIVVNGSPVDCTGTPITMVPCDYDNSGYINAKDTNVYFASIRNSDISVGDFDRNGYVNAKDTNVYYKFLRISNITNIYSNQVIC